jgi:ribosomal protein L7/L12
MEMDDSVLIRRLAVLEQQVRLLSQTAGVPCPAFASDGDSLPAEVIALLRSGKKLQAIKLLMQLTGAGLAEAKAAVDAF